MNNNMKKTTMKTTWNSIWRNIKQTIWRTTTVFPVTLPRDPQKIWNPGRAGCGPPSPEAASRPRTGTARPPKPRGRDRVGQAPAGPRQGPPARREYITERPAGRNGATRVCPSLFVIIVFVCVICVRCVSAFYLFPYVSWLSLLFDTFV